MSKATAVRIAVSAVVVVALPVLWLLMSNRTAVDVMPAEPPAETAFPDNRSIDMRGKNVQDVLLDLKRDYAPHVAMEQVWYIPDGARYAPWYIIHNLQLTSVPDFESRGQIAENSYVPYKLEQWYWDKVRGRLLSISLVAWASKPERELMDLTYEVRTETIMVRDRRACIVVSRREAAEDFPQPYAFDAQAIWRTHYAEHQYERKLHAFGFYSEAEALREAKRIIKSLELLGETK